MPQKRRLKNTVKNSVDSTPKKTEHKKESKKVGVSTFIKNRTNQKQVLQTTEGLYVLNAYEKNELKLDFANAEKLFSYWIDKNIVELKKQ